MLLRPCFRTITVSFGAWILALSMLWLSLAASASIEGRVYGSAQKASSAEATSPSGEEQSAQPPFAIFQPWPCQSNQSGWAQPDLTGPDHDFLEGAGLFGKFLLGDLGKERPTFPKLLLPVREYGLGFCGFGRAP